MSNINAKSKVKHNYCTNCLKVVEFPKRKKIDSFHYQIWLIIILATLGFGLIPFLIYRFVMTKKNRCPECFSKITLISTQEFSALSEHPMRHAIERVELEKKEKKEREKREIEREEREKERERREKERIEYVECIYCRKKIEKNASICPYCGTEN